MRRWPRPSIDFVARADFVAKHGTSIEKGERFTIGSDRVVDSTDGYGNKGTKRIIRSAAPKEGLAFYCYGYNSAERAFRSIDWSQIEHAMDGCFIVERALQ